jgi:hypothetical protein
LKHAIAPLVGKWPWPSSIRTKWLSPPPDAVSLSKRASITAVSLMASRLVKRWLPERKHPEPDSPELKDSDIAVTPTPSSENGTPGSKEPVVEVGDEKVVPGSTTPSTNDGWADDHPAIRDIPFSVRRIVSLDDDPTLPTLTFRYFVLTILFVLPGAFLSQMSHFRTTYAPYSVFFVQIASNYVGMWLAKILPAWNVRLPFTSFSFNLNPGPWGVKEHVLVTISAASGATYNLAYAPVSIAELYFNQRMNAGVAIVFMWVVVSTSSYVLPRAGVRGIFFSAQRLHS